MATRFERVASARFGFVHRLPRGSLPDYVASWSGVANLESGPREKLLDDVRGWSVAETLALPFRIEVVLGRRLHA